MGLIRRLCCFDPAPDQQPVGRINGVGIYIHGLAECPDPPGIVFHEDSGSVSGRNRLMRPFRDSTPAGRFDVPEQEFLPAGVGENELIAPFRRKGDIPEIMEGIREFYPGFTGSRPSVTSSLTGSDEENRGQECQCLYVLHGPDLKKNKINNFPGNASLRGIDNNCLFLRHRNMALSTKYDPSENEDKWYAYWEEHKLFRSVPDDRRPFTIVMPPPNVTGVLHMGHMLNNTIQDVLVRRKRMEGYNALWVPGTDHASIATEARIVARLREEGTGKKEIGRDAFLKRAWDWNNEHGGIILRQLRKLGASCDWKRTRFTMDGDYYASVIRVFVDLYEKGLIYRGVRMINWDPQARTAVSDEEVIYRETRSMLYHVSYRVEGSKDRITIATTRPETILGDTAVAVHPGDERYAAFHGKSVIVPIVERSVPLITDEYVDREFGTGALKITPAHDINDYEIGLKHGLESIDILNDDGTLGESAGFCVGTDRFEARSKVADELERRGQLVKKEPYVNKVGFSERTDAVIEPRLSLQWFLRMEDLAKPALESVLNGEVRLHPQKFRNLYRHWMENVRDWCISRQLWWGQRIPAWYIRGGNDFVVAENGEEALEKARMLEGNENLSAGDLRQDEDVLDTWFSSWLWPIAVFNGILEPQNADYKYYYPTSDLVTAPEILFFWVARMIVAGYLYPGGKPFSNVYLTGIVRDSQRRKMSKSLGNSPEPLDLIAKYSADGVRVGMLLCSPAGGDLLYDDSLPEQGRNFGNKIWNAYRLTRGWDVDASSPQPGHSREAILWFSNRLSAGIVQLEKDFRSYRISQALMTLYRLFWDEFSSWYLELVKPEYGKPVDEETAGRTEEFFDVLLRLLHPFMPFITEGIWQSLRKRKVGESIMQQPVPQAGRVDEGILEQFEILKEVVSSLRTIRKQEGIPPRQALDAMIMDRNGQFGESFVHALQKLGNLKGLEPVGKRVGGAVSFRVKAMEFFVSIGSGPNREGELKKLRDELEYTRGFLKKVAAKLGNRRFVESAPGEVVAREKKKQEDAELTIRTLKERIRNLE